MDTYEKKIREYLNNGEVDELYKNMLLNLFPELKESEDERIRKGLIKAVSRTFEGNTLFGTDVTREEALAWLEKQGEKKPDDKVEPKFKVGDFIVNDYCMGKVIELTGDAYLLDTGQGIPFSCEHNAHLWTIADAKDGDVLSDGTTVFIFKDLLSDGSVMSYCDYDTDSGESDAFCPLSVNLMCSKITPATKEQSDTFFAKMKESGYEWDAEKKELKKIEQKSQRMISAEAKEAMYGKPAWSEEDELVIKDIEEAITNYWHGQSQEDLLDRLKSLKQRIGG